MLHATIQVSSALLPESCKNISGLFTVVGCVGDLQGSRLLSFILILILLILLLLLLKDCLLSLFFSFCA